MRVELLLDPRGPHYRDIVEGLKEELAELSGLEYREVSEAAPPKTLSVEHDIVKFVFDHPQLTNLVIALIQLTRSVIERVGANKTKVPQAVVIVGDGKLKLPASDAAEKRFLANVSGPRPKRTGSKHTKRSRRTSKESLRRRR